ncbi:monosaccharide ABC transporter substrate-binding protein, CUT2 family [Magnetococcus marinus MC-1]|uniref:Monosaccharide ABC transporter substrate-binding protein, CUT2 family n=2 Tax=Magnetococcus TaxID=162171 RepID=A0LA89_MAGMM|nr:monosaccharide ABC transporter substrate-binding protein, CUT2 family [Magnetococcus marinus MC-1]
MAQTGRGFDKTAHVLNKRLDRPCKANQAGRSLSAQWGASRVFINPIFDRKYVLTAMFINIPGWRISRPMRTLPAIVMMTLYALAGLAHAQQPPWRVGFCQDTLDIPWRAAQAMTFSQTLQTDKRFQVILSDAKGNTTQQAIDLEHMVERGVHVLVTSPRDGAVLTPVISNIYRQGVPVVLLSRRTLDENFTTFIAPDDAEIGRQAARYLSKRLNEKGKILVIQGLGSASTTQQRTVGFIQELSLHPHMQIVAQPFANYKKEMAILIMESILAQKLPFDAIYVHSDAMALGAILALKRAGIDPTKLPIVSIDYTRAGRESLRKGEIDAIFTYPNGVKQGITAVKRILAGQPVNKFQTVPSTLVTQENINTLEPVF